MRVSFVTVKQKENATSIKELCKDFSKDMPHPLPLEGGQGINYVVCIPITDKNEIKRICNKNNYTVSKFSIISSEVDDNTFNSSYSISIRYFEDPMYTLEK